MTRPSFAELGGVARRVVVGVVVREGSPGEPVELVRGARLRGQLSPELRVRILAAVGLGVLADVLELPAVEGQWLEPEPRDLHTRALDLAARIRVTAPLPAPVDRERDDVARRHRLDARDVARAERHLPVLAEDTDARRALVHLHDHGFVACRLERRQRSKLHLLAEDAHTRRRVALARLHLPFTNPLLQVLAGGHDFLLGCATVAR